VAHPGFGFRRSDWDRLKLLALKSPALFQHRYE
jgi:hypothetical protein